MSLKCCAGPWWPGGDACGSRVSSTYPESGPVLIVPNHDSQTDPLVVAVAIRSRRRLRFLARAELWRIPLLGPILDGLGQIAIRRGAGDSAALGPGAAGAACRRGARCVSRRTAQLGCPDSRPPRRGAACRLVPGGGHRPLQHHRDDGLRAIPRRPRVTVRFFAPSPGRSDEDAGTFAARLLAELRRVSPPVPAGRKAIVGGPPRIRRALARRESDRR